MSRPAALVVAALTLACTGLFGTAHADATGCPPPSGAAFASAAAPLDLNRATEAELLELPGVGPAKAKAILAFREQHGGFSSVSQLMRIKGFGRATLKRLRPLLTVTPPEPVAPPHIDRVR